MASLSVELPVGPQGARIFFGYRAAELSERPEDDDAQKEKKKKTFFEDLGRTFMPGTPLMQAPLGLAAYLPAVIDPTPDMAVPDEVAIIVYASRPVYDRFRETSLSRRMYTKSHVAVFDMPNSAAQFPGPLDAPVTRPLHSGGEQLFVYASDAACDWQSGATRIVLIAANGAGSEFQQAVLEQLRRCQARLGEFGVQQILAGIDPGYAAFWIHSAAPVEDVEKALGLGELDATIYRSLDAQAAWVIGDSEPGVAIDGPCAYSFRFERDLSLFDRPAA